MNSIVRVLLGLVAGYLIGIGLGAFTAFVLGYEDAARFVAIGCGLIGAFVGPRVFSRLDLQQE